MRSPRPNREKSPADSICLACGLCCNGVIFADVQLLAEEKPGPLLALGLPVSKSGRRTRSWKFRQPCAAFDGCRCRIYASRPKHCRHFECLLLKEFQSGTVTRPAALAVIGRARRQAERVEKLLELLGDNDRQMALRERFRQTAKRLERCELPAETKELFGQLTVAFHELNLTLQSRFYPMPQTR